MVKICVDLEDIEAYEELKRYLKSKSGKYRGLLGHEIAKAIKLYVQQLKASEGAPQSPQPQLPVTVEKAKESKPIEHRETTKELESKVEGLAKRLEDLEDLKQKVEDISKELKATQETVKSFIKSLSTQIDNYVKQRLEQATKLETKEFAEKLINHMTFCEDCQEGLTHAISPILTKYKDKIINEVKSEVLKEVEKRLPKQEEKKGFLW
jgi:ATP-dependent exoDNAse (exonuclease V) beta subunit